MGKSKYKGVHQRKNGTWYYRIKKKSPSGSIDYYQQSGFKTEEEANKARISHLREIAYKEGIPFDDEELRTGAYKKQQVIEIQSVANYEHELKPFREVFQDFLYGYIDSESSRKKYQALYNAQLQVWADKEIHSFKDTDIDLLLLKLSLEGYKATYISSIRKLIKMVFNYANLVDYTVRGDIAVGIDTKPYKLRVLSLFSGIGAPEQALKNLGIDYELVNFCEIDDKAAEAYCLLHGGDTEKERKELQSKRIKDVNELLAGLRDYDWEYEKGVFQGFGLDAPEHGYDGYIPDFDIMFFGFPCQDISKLGHQKGLKDEDGELTRSGLFFKAMQIAYIKKPKIMIAENVAALVGNAFRDDFARVIQEFEDCGYTYYNRKVDAKKFGLPQSRERVFMVLVRDDLDICYKFPNGFPLEIRAEEWFEPVVDDEYYVAEEKVEKLKERKSRKPNFNRDYITCITTGWGTPSYPQQTYVEDAKGVRCLSSEELMRFQGFTTEQGKMLRAHGFSKNEVGHMVGNSIAVPAIQAVLENLFSQLCKERPPVKYEFTTNEKEKYTGPYIQPLFSYMGNKSKLLKRLIPSMPQNLADMNFVDLFAGAATVAINVNAKRILINDVSEFLVGIYKGLSCTPPEKGWARVCQIVEKYHLDADTQEYYDQCRIEYNVKHAHYADDYWYWGLALVYHSYNRNTIAHNLSGDFNSAYGHDKCDMGASKKRFFPFAKKMYESNYEFSSKDFRKALPEDMKPEETFIYVDPPYLITSAGYNKIWHKEDEIALYQYLDDLHKRGYRWMLSNVTQNKEKENDILLAWIEEHKDEYHVQYLDRNYNNCSANSQKKGTTVEVLITNYKV